jgi:hypothetical protein
MDNRGSIPGRCNVVVFSSPPYPDRLWCPPSHPPIHWVQRALSPVLKRPGREADHSPHSSAEAKKSPSPPYVFMAWGLVKQWDYLAITFTFTSCFWLHTNNKMKVICTSNFLFIYHNSPRCNIFFNRIRGAISTHSTHSPTFQMRCLNLFTYLTGIHLYVYYRLLSPCQWLHCYVWQMTYVTKHPPKIPRTEIFSICMLTAVSTQNLAPVHLSFLPCSWGTTFPNEHRDIELFPYLYAVQIMFTSEQSAPDNTLQENAPPHPSAPSAPATEMSSWTPNGLLCCYQQL